MANTLIAGDLLERYEQEISEKEERINQVQAELETSKEGAKKRSINLIMKKARTKIEELTTRTAEIKAIASTQQQREYYGAENWEQQFVSLNELEELDGFPETGMKLRLLLWKKFPNCRFKRFQELFSKPEDFSLPRFRIEGQTMIFEDITNVHDLSLEPTLVDILENLQIVSFESAQKNPVEHLRLKADAIARLKEIFETAGQISDQNHRILVVRSMQDSDDSIEEEVQGAPHAIEGSILYLRSDERADESTIKTEQFPRRVVQYFPSAYNAQRKTFHEEAAYNEEIGQLSDLVVRLENMNQELNRNWKKDTDQTVKDEMRVRANTLFTECAETLQFCENRFKVKAKSHITKIQSLVGSDILKAPNISAGMTCMVATRDALRTRHDDMRMKGRYNQDDRQSLEQELRTHEFRFEQYGREIITVASRIDLSLELFGKTDLSAQSIQRNVAGLLTPMHIDALDKITMSPFVLYATRMKQKYDQLEAVLSQQNKEQARDILIQMHVIRKFLDVQKTFETIKRDILDPRFVSVARVQSFVSELNHVFSTFQIFPNRTVESYEAAYEAMKEKLSIIENQLGMYAATEMTIEERTEMYGRLKMYLDSFDIPAIVTELE
jgi:hypothetical protein